MYGKTNDQVFLEEERENELDEVIDDGLTKQHAHEEVTTATVAEAGQQTVQSIKSGEDLIEAIALWQSETDAEKEWLAGGQRGPAPTPHVLIQYSDEGEKDAYLLKAFKRVSAAQLDQALTLLPFALVPSLCAILNQWAERGWESALTLKVATRLLDLFYRQVRSDGHLIRQLTTLQHRMTDALQRDREMIGFNLSALAMLRRMWATSHETTFSIEEVDAKAQLAGQQVRTGHTIGAKKRKNKKRGQLITDAASPAVAAT